jgi:hypothetical protein
VTSQHEQELLLEAAATPYREHDREGRLVPPPAWWDLSPEAREALFSRQLASRALERAVDPSGQSATVRAVLARLGRPASTP